MYITFPTVRPIRVYTDQELSPHSCNGIVSEYPAIRRRAYDSDVFPPIVSLCALSIRIASVQIPHVAKIISHAALSIAITRFPFDA